MFDAFSLFEIAGKIAGRLLVGRIGIPCNSSSDHVCCGVYNIMTKLIKVIRNLLCSLGIHKFTPWEYDPVPPVGFGSYRRWCLRCGRREAKM